MFLPHYSGQRVRCMSLASGSERERENTRYKLNYFVENILLAWFLNEVIALKSAGAVSVLWWYKSSWSWRRFIISYFGSMVEGRDRERVDIHMLMKEEDILSTSFCKWILWHCKENNIFWIVWILHLQFRLSYPDSVSVRLMYMSGGCWSSLYFGFSLVTSLCFFTGSTLLLISWDAYIEKNV